MKKTKIDFYPRVHERLSEKKDLENEIIIKNSFSRKICSRVQKIKERKYVKYTCSMETVQQNGRFTLF